MRCSADPSMKNAAAMKETAEKKKGINVVGRFACELRVDVPMCSKLSIGGEFVRSIRVICASTNYTLCSAVKMV